jgi:hypothetical protein
LRTHAKSDANNKQNDFHKNWTQISTEKDGLDPIFLP